MNSSMVANRLIVSPLFMILMLTSVPARADFTFQDGGKPAPAAELAKFFSGKTWVWPCKNCGAYFAPDGTYTTLWIEKGSPQVGHGTWTAKEGALCWSVSYSDKAGTKPLKEQCRNAKMGPGTDGGSKAKMALGLQMQDSSGYMWVWQDKQVWKEFKRGDHIRAAAVKAEASFSNK
jgi:hypothetical protein